MKHHYLTAAVLALTATTALPVAALEPGEYNVGSGGTYATVTEAVSALTETETTGDVTFILAPGTYDEEITVPQLSASVTFRGTDGVKLTNTKEGATSVFSVATTAPITFEGLAFEGTPSLSFITCTAVSNNLTVKDCSFTGGKFAVNMIDQANDLSITGSTFTNLDIAIYGQNGVYRAVITGNSFKQDPGLNRPNLYRSLLAVLRDKFNIENNRFNISLDSKGGRLIDVYSSYTNDYSNVNSNPALAHTGIIANNEAIINVEAEKAIATFLSIGNNVGGFLVANNSISFTGKAPYSSFYAMQMRDNGNLFYQGNIFTNNVYQNQAGGTFVHILYPGTETNYYYEGMGTNMLWGEGLSDRVWIRSQYPSGVLGDDISVRGTNDFMMNYGPQCYFADPKFTVESLMPGSWANLFNRGDARVEITSSLNGISREKYMSVGAYERVLPDNLEGEALAGEYTIGESDCDFESVADAVLALKNRGVSAAVTFSIEDGTYEGTYTLNTVEGASEENNITFQSANESASDVILLNTLGYGGTSYNSDYATMPAIFDLDGASWITLRNITIENSGRNFPTLVKLKNSASHITVDGCLLVQQQTDSNYGNDAHAIFSYNYGADYNDTSRDFPNNYLTVSGCEFTINQVEGYRGNATGEYSVAVFTQNAYGPKQTGVTIENCTFTDYHQAVSLGYNNAVTIKGNTFYCHDFNVYFISTYTLYDNSIIEGNKFLYEQTQEFTYDLEAIAIRASGDNDNRLPIINNEFIVRNNTNSGLKAVFADGSNIANALIAHNSICYTGEMRTPAALAYCSPTTSNPDYCKWTETEIVNNLFVSDSENATPFVFGNYYSGTPTWEQAMAGAQFKHNLIYVPAGHVALGQVPGTATTSSAARVAGDDNDVRMDLDAFHTHVGERGLNNQTLASMPEFEEGSLKPTSFAEISGKGMAGVIDHDIAGEKRDEKSATPGAYENNETSGIDSAVSNASNGISVVDRIITVTGYEGKKLDIYNMQGTLLESYDINADNFTANTTLTSGLYVARVADSTVKFIVK